MESKPNYRIHKDDIPEIRITPEDPENTASFVVRMIHGTETSLMFADRGSGYHTKPHYHASEQFNYVLSGEMWFFVEKHGYRCKEGDIMRIPKNKIHWAWNRTEKNVILLETHSPPLIGIEGLKDKVVSLLGMDEDPKTIQRVDNIRDPYNQKEVDEIEARAIAEEG